MAKAFIIVDMLNDFVREDGALTCGDRVRQIVEPIRQRLEEARSAGEVVIYMCDAHRPDDPEFQQFPPHAVQGTEGAQVIAELAPRPTEYVLPKRRYSAFHSSQLLLVLLERGVREIELCGV
ncbi:MAG: cysteine hydrolase family protein, partial [Armatimonadota bacterium]